MQLGSNPRRYALALSVTCVAPVLLGVTLAVLPAGGEARLAACVLGALFVLVAVMWPDAPRTNFRLLIGGACASFLLQFLWPKYAYIPLDVLPTKNPQRMFYLVFLAYFVFALSTSRQLREHLATRIKSAPVLMGLVMLFFSWRLISATAARDPFTSAYAGAIEAFDFLTPFLLVITIFRHKRDLGYLVSALLAASALICLLAIVETAVEKNLFAPLIAIDATRMEYFQEVLLAKVRDRSYRVQASFDHPLLLAEFLVCMLPLLLYRFGRAKAWERPMLMLQMAMILWVIFKTQSRSAIAAGLFAALAFASVYFLRTFARRRLDVETTLSLFAIPAFLVLAAFAYSYVVELAVGRTSAEQASSVARFAMLNVGIPLLLARPVFGYGVGYGPQTLGFLIEKGRFTLDNYYLLLVLDSGVPALVFLLAIVGWSAVRGLQTAFSKDRDEAYLGAALSVSLISFAVVKSVLGTALNFPLFFMLLGALVVLRSPLGQERARLSPTTRANAAGHEA